MSDEPLGDLSELERRRELTEDTGRPEAVARRHEAGGRTARENIADLVDPGSLIEYGRFTVAAQRGRRELDDLIARTPADGLSFGASAYPEAVIDQPAQFDFYDGGGIDLAVLGMAELDAVGNVNVSRFGSGAQASIAGVGGFINITQGARALVFMGTFTAGGLQVQAADGRLRIVQEGRTKKIVAAVSHLSYNAAYMAQRGQKVRYITERAVFELRPDTQGAPRLTLVEIAPGIDIQRDVLDPCETAIAVADDLRLMDARLFDAASLRL